MDCRQVEREDLLAEYVGGQLSPDVQADLELHILECERCQQALDTLQVARDVLAARADHIRSYSPAARVPVRWVWVGAAAFCVVLCSVGVSWLILRHRTNSQTAEQNGASPNTKGAEKAISPDVLQHPNETAEKGPDHAHGQPAVQGGPNVQPPQPFPQPPADGKTETAEQEPGPLPPSIQPNRPGWIDFSRLESHVSSWSEQQAKDLARLSEITPPAYTFSGLAGSKPTSSGLPSSTLEPSRPELRLPGGAQSLFQDAMLAYVEKRYGDAEVLLEDTLKLAPGAPEINLYLGICQLVNGKADEAVHPLQSVLAHENSPYTQSAHFYLAKAYLQIWKVSKAEEQLGAAAAMPGPLNTEAKALLEKIQAIAAQGSK
jgi:TolA-binding protein